MKGSIVILFLFFGGVALAYNGLVPAAMLGADLSTWVLYALMFMVGLSLGLDPNAIDTLRSINYRVLIAPIGVIVGSIAGSLAVSFALNSVSAQNAMAIGSGFGYYSLSSIFIGKISGEEMGVVALLSNMIRELSTLLLAPLYVRYFGKLAPIAAAGATAMDTCLPVIVKYSGKEVAVASLFCGITLTAIVPFLVVLIAS